MSVPVTAPDSPHSPLWRLSGRQGEPWMPRGYRKPWVKECGDGPRPQPKGYPGEQGWRAAAGWVWEGEPLAGDSLGRIGEEPLLGSGWVQEVQSFQPPSCLNPSCMSVATRVERNEPAGLRVGPRGVCLCLKTPGFPRLAQLTLVRLFLTLKHCLLFQQTASS